MKKYCIEIHNGIDITSCLYLYYGGMEVLNKIISIMDNYNKNLASADLSEELIAVRMFEEENEEGTLGSSTASLMPRSYQCVKEEYPNFRLLGLANTNIHGKIALTDLDVYDNRDDADFRITINFHTKSVDLDEMIESETLYSFMKKVPLASKPNTPNFNFEKVSFNELEDVQSFIKNNRQWVDEEEEYIYYTKAV